MVQGDAGVIQDYVMFTGVNILLAWSVYIILLSGSLSFGNGAFMAIGAYLSGVLTVKFAVPLLIAVLVAGICTGFFGVLVGFPALRTRGVYLILVTVGIAASVRTAIEAIDYVGGVRGFGGLSGANPWQITVLVAVVGGVLWMVSRSPLQRILDAVREDEQVAGALGINVVQVKLASFGMGAALAAIAGGFYGHYMMFLRPDEFGIMLSVYIVFYVILGGANNLCGPALGAAFLTLAPEFIRGLDAWRPTVYGLLIVLLLLIRPEGLLTFRLVTARTAHLRRPMRISSMSVRNRSPEAK
jgi:branched-chain amino acid transport system permease protein